MKKLLVLPIAFGLVFAGAGSVYAQGVRLDLDSTTSVGITDDVNIGTNIEATTSIEGDTEGVGITVTRSSASESSIEAAIGSSAEVETSSELSLFASAVVKTDENVDEVGLSEDAVSLRYKQRAKLFGIIPVFVYVKATTDSNGNVSVSYPWYGFLLSQEERVNVETDLQATVSQSLAASADATLTSSAQAQLLEEMRLVLQSNLEASLEAEVATAASTN